MPKYIDAENFREWILKQKRLSKNYTVMMLDETPTADVQEVKHGKWLTEEYMYGRDGMEDSWVERLAEDGDCAYCSECRKNAGLDGGEEYVLSNYCPNCGAKMDLEDKQ